MLIISMELKPSAEEVRVLEDAGALIVETRNLTGSETAIDVVLHLTESIVPIIIAYIIGRYRMKEKIKISYDGIEIQGISEDNAEKLILKLIKKRKKR